MERPLKKKNKKQEKFFLIPQATKAYFSQSQRCL